MSGGGPRGAPGRSAARLAAVQALYQIGMGGAGPAEVIAEFVQHRLDGEPGEGSSPPADRTLFAELVTGVSERREEVDGLVADVLSEDWTLARLELLLRIVIEAGVWEMLARPDVPARVVIDEYVEVAHAFFSRGEPGMVNGILDRLGRRLRPDEFTDGAA